MLVCAPASSGKTVLLGMSDTEKEHTMRVFAGRAGGAIGARLVPRLIEHGHKVTGATMSLRNAGRVRALGAEPITLHQPPARVWRRVAGGS